MRNLTTALLLSMVSACSAQPPAETPPAADAPTVATSESAPTVNSAEAWLERVEQRAAEIETLTANLRYDRNQLLLGDEQRRFGTLTYEAGPPPRFNVHFNKKLVDGHWSLPDLYYIYDGRWLLKRDHESKSAVRYQLVADDEDPAEQMELGEGPFPIPLNLRKDKVLERFEVVVAEPAEDDPENCVHLTLTPLENNDTDLTQIDFWFERDTALPVQVASMDESETQTVVLLMELQVNPELGEQTFDTSLPKGPDWQTDENRIAPAPPTPDPQP